MKTLETQPEIEMERNASKIDISFSEIIASVGLLIASISMFSSFIILPEKVARNASDNDKQDAKIADIYRLTHEKFEAIARIDERTKRIESALTNH